MTTRRIFLKNGALTVVGMGMVPRFLFRSVLAARSDSRRVLVCVFQRGGADGLNIVVPFADEAYYKHRPSIAIPAPSKERRSAIDLDGFFGLHPSLGPLAEIYKSGQMAVVHSVGSPDSTRSHFDAQDFMETAAPGNKFVRDGWLNRYLQVRELQDATALRAVAMGQGLPRSLRGPASALAFGQISEFDLAANEASAEAGSAYQTLYSEETNSLLSGTAREMFDAIEFLKKADFDKLEPAKGVEYANNSFAQQLRQIAQLIKIDAGLEVAFVEIGGWDTHSNQGGVQGRLGGRLNVFGQALSAFYRDLGDRVEDVVVLTMSEFGRTARENGSSGTDHGHANVMMLLGGPIKGGKVYGDWPGLAREQLNEDRDLALTTDFRDVFAETLTKHLRCDDPDGVFPDFSVSEKRFRGVL